MDLRWFPPKDAQKMLDGALRAGLITREAGQIRPTFDPSAVDVPLDFAPTAAALQVPEPPRDVLSAILNRIVAATGLETRTIVAEVNQVQGRMGIDIEAAALLVGRARQVPIDDFLDADSALTSEEKRPSPPA